MKRRLFLKSASFLAGGLALVTSPLRLFAEWNDKAFTADQMSAAMKDLFGTSEFADSKDIKIKAADIAENGAVVPVTVTSEVADTDFIAIFVENNPSPLAAGFRLSGESSPKVSTRIKMGKTSNVFAVVRSGEKLYATKKEVKVTIGGCGG